MKRLKAPEEVQEAVREEALKATQQAKWGPMNSGLSEEQLERYQEQAERSSFRACGGVIAEHLNQKPQLKAQRRLLPRYGPCPTDPDRGADRLMDCTALPAQMLFGHVHFCGFRWSRFLDASAISPPWTAHSALRRGSPLPQARADHGRVWHANLTPNNLTRPCRARVALLRLSAAEQGKNP